MKVILVLFALVALDTSPRKTNHIKSEELGSSWTAGVSENLKGLAVQHYYNTTLKRDEVWHQTAAGEWFVQAGKSLFVHGVYRADGTWRTNPAVTLRHRKGKWIRVSTEKK